MRLPRELRDEIYQLVLDTGILEVPQPMKFVREDGMLERPRYADSRFFFLTPDLLLVSRQVYEEARGYVNKYIIIEMAPLSRLPSFEKLLDGMIQRASRFRKVEQLVIPQERLPQGDERRMVWHSGYVQNAFRALKVVVWPNGGDHPKSRNDRETAVRLCFDRADLKLIDVECDIVKKESEEDKGKAPVIDGTHTWHDWVPEDINLEEEIDPEEDNNPEEYEDKAPIKYGRHDWRGWAPKDGWEKPILLESEPGIPKAGSRRYVSRNSGRFLGSYY